MLVKVTPQIFQKAKTETQNWAAQLAHYAGWQDWLGQTCSTLTGRSGSLLDLAKVELTCPILGYHLVGRQTVLLNQIRGSTSPARCQDFDRHFHPLKSHTRSCWLRVASARQLGLVLPPVELVQVGDIYFVRDGHHRISVAQALGQVEFEAEVRVWQVAGPLAKDLMLNVADPVDPAKRLAH